MSGPRLDADGLEDWLAARLATPLGLAPADLDVEAPFAELGLDSLQAVEVSGDLERLLGQRLDPTLLWEFPSIRRLAAHLAALEPGAAPAPPPGAPTFSLFFFAADDEAPEDGYAFMLAAAERADQLGFEAVWLPERHFHALGGLFPNPAVAAAAVAARTTRVAIRAGSIVAPLHDPLRVAEEWAMVDRLSGGRVGLAFASGWHADDFVFAPDRYADRRAAAVEGLEAVRRLWRGEALARRNGAGTEIPVVTRPRPVGGELETWLTAIGNPTTFEAAGRCGANLLTSLLGQSVEDLAPKIARYRAARAAAGYAGPGRVTVMVHAFLGEDRAAVKARVRAPFMGYLGGSLALIGPLAASLGATLSLDQLDEADRQALLDHAFERWFEGAALLGDQADGRRMATRLAAAGVDEIGCLIDWGLGLDEVLASLTRIDAVAEALAADGAWA